MMVPSGNGSFPSREALIATSLPRIARKSLRLPSSWATEINLQSRYPGGILIPKIGAASSPRPDAGAVRATTPATVANATSTKTTRLIGRLLQMCRSFVGRKADKKRSLVAEEALSRLRDRLSDRSEKLNDLHRLLFFVHLAFCSHLLSHLALGHIGIADLCDLAVLAHNHRIPTLVVGGA